MSAQVIQGTAIRIKEYAGKRVVTFKDIDTVHKRREGTASRNFNQNRNRFIEDIDFFKIKITDNEIRSQFGISPNAGGTVILVTETGYLMLVKSFTDDLAWKVQRELIDSYFRSKAEPDKQVVQDIIDSGIPTVVVATDKLIKCAEIMAGCLDGNRQYVLNILKHIVPNIEESQINDIEVESVDDTVSVPEITEKVTLTDDGRCYNVPFNAKMFSNYLISNGISDAWLAKKVGVGRTSVFNWQNGVKPSMRNRRKLCEVLDLPIGYFDNNRRVRRM